MSALFCAPVAFTASTSGTYPQSNANLDQPGLIARGTSITATFASQSIDTIAIIGNQTGTITVSGGVTTSVQAFTGTKAAGVTAKTLIRFGAVTASTITVTFAQSTDVQRLIIGKAVTTTGIDVDAEQSFEDQSVFYNGPGYVGVDEYQVVPTWKFRCSWISDTQWRDEFWPLWLTVGQRRGFLFVPNLNTPTTWQHEACFGRLTSMAKGQHSNADNWVVEGTMAGITA